MERRRALRWLRPLLDKPGLWSTSRRAMATGLAVGLFFGLFVPFGQALIAGAIAVLLRGNLPVAVAATFVSNPLTTPAIVAGAYFLGSGVLGVAAGAPIASDLAWTDRVASAGPPLMTGLLIVAAAASAAGFCAAHVGYRTLALARLRRWRRASARRRLDAAVVLKDDGVNGSANAGSL